MSTIKDTLIRGLYIRKGKTSSNWYVQARVAGGGPTRIKLGSTDALTTKQARIKARKVLHLLSEGINPNRTKKQIDDTQLSLKQAVDRMLKEKSERLKPSTANGYRSVINRNFPDWMDRPIASITSEQVTNKYRQIRLEVATRNRIKKRLTNSPGEAEAQKAMRCLSAVFSHFEEDQRHGQKVLPQGNVVRVLGRKRLRPKLQRRTNCLSPLDLRQINLHLSSSEAPFTGQQKDWVLLLLLSGMRYQEPLSLKWGDIYNDKGTFVVRQTKSGQPLVLPLTNSIKLLFDRRRSFQKISGIRTEWVFPQRSNPTRPATMSKVIERLARLTDLEFTAHDIRRTVASTLSSLGYDITTVGRILNHTPANITDCYIRKTPGELSGALEDLHTELQRQVGMYLYGTQMAHTRKTTPVGEG